MAEKTVISIEVEGTGKAINSIKELKAELKAAQSAALNGDGKAAKRVAELKDKMDDLTDSTKSLQGSGVERIGSGFNLLSQGFQDMDLDKIKTGFKGLGSAMSAIPIFLIIEGLKLLWDNFDVVAEFAKKFFTIASDGEKKINSLNYELEKQKETTAALSKEINRELELMEAQGESSDKLLAKKKELIHQQIQEAISTAKLNIAKVQEVNNNDSITESIIRKNAEVLRTLGFDSKAAELEKTLAVQKYERNKDNIKSAKDSFELIKDLQNKELVETVKVNKQSNEQYKKHLEEQNKIRQDNEKLISENTIAGAQIDKDNRKLIADDISAEEAEKLKLAKERDDAEYAALVKKIQDEKDAAAQKLSIEKYLQEQKQSLRNADLNNAAAVIGLFKQLTSKNKELQKVALVAENGIAIAKMIIANSASNVAVTAQGAALAVATGGASVAAAAALVIRNNISTGIGVAASIAATAKALGALGGGDAGSAPTLSGGSGGGSPSIPTSNGTPSIAAPTQNTTTFTGNVNNNFNQPPIKTYVVETDLRNSTNTIDKIKDQATF